MIEDVADLWSFGADDCDARCITTNGSVKGNGRAVMGRGVALQATRRYAGIALALGTLLKIHGNHVQVLVLPKQYPWLVTFPVKHEWHMQANLELIARSAGELVLLADELGWKKVVIPRPGCGNGGRSWEREVRPLIRPMFDDRFTVVTL